MQTLLWDKTMTRHTLQDYIDLLRREGLLVGEIPNGLTGEETVDLVSCDSREVVAGTLFICKGSHFREEYLRTAADRGALCYVSECAYPDVALPGIIVSDIRLATADLANFYYGEPWQDLELIGITGTKGKSSVAYYIRSILDQYLRETGGQECGLISSIDTYDGQQRFESHLTTPEPLDLQRHFDHAVQSGITYFVMEVSSQALKYDRVHGVRFNVGCFLNIDSDHISPIEHTDWEDYFTSKLRIFELCDTAVVNLDADHIDRILEAAENAGRIITISQRDEDADFYAYDVRRDGEGISFRVRSQTFDRHFRLGMPGLFNVQNALAAIAVCTTLGIPEHDQYTGLMRARVPGRMEVYTNANHRITAIVDYAHNALSFEKLFRSIQEEYPGQDIKIVFGCPGKKALDRRHDLGEIAGRYAAHAYLTEEDPGEEDPYSICEEIAGYVAAEGCPYSIYVDRGDAIRAAVMEADLDTVILITGKGAETREKRGMEYIGVPSDVDYIKAALEDYDTQHRLDGIGQVHGLLNLLPRFWACSGETIVIKYGGSALVGTDVVDSILQDVAVLRMIGARVVVVHGGGKEIDSWLKRLDIKPMFSGGYRVTDASTMDVVEMTLSGQVNKRIVEAFRAQDVSAVGVSGRDGGLIRARKKLLPDVDLGHVGEIESVDPKLLLSLLDAGYVPVVSPVAEGPDHEACNVNADDAACAIACALEADRLIYLTDIDGLMIDTDNDKTMMHMISQSCAEELLEEDMISGGMAPKLNDCVAALRHGIASVMVLDGRVEHTLLLAIATGQYRGTMVVPDDVMEHPDTAC